MAGRSRSHSEARWSQLPETIIRCNGTRPSGSRCKREAEPGSVACDMHGGLAPQVRRRAAERVIMTADVAAQLLVKWMEDPSVPFGVRAKIAQDLMDRAGLIATQVHQIVPSTEDPVMRFFADIDPAHLVVNPTHAPASAPAIEGYAPTNLSIPDEDHEVFDAEIVEDQPAATVNGDDTPARIRQMIQDHVFDSQPAARS